MPLNYTLNLLLDTGREQLNTCARGQKEKPEYITMRRADPIKAIEHGGRGRTCTSSACLHRHWILSFSRDSFLTFRLLGRG